MKIYIKILLANLITIMFSLSCHTQQVTINWKAIDMPAVDGRTSPGYAGSIAGINNGFLILAGGANFPAGLPWEGGKKVYHNQLYLFRLAGRDLKLVETTTLPFAIAYAANVTTTTGMIVAGGENENGISKKVFRLKVKNDRSIQIDSLPDMPFALTNAAMASVEEKVYVAGGEMKDSVSNNLLMLDLENISEGWQKLSAVPHPVSHAVLVNTGKQLILAGGRMKDQSGISRLYKEVYQYDLKSNTWSAKSSLPYALSAGTAIPFPGKGMILFGGDKGETFQKVEKSIADMTHETNAEKRQVINEKKNLLLRSHPGFSRDILMYLVHEDKWKIIGSIPYAAPVTTTAVRCDKYFYIPSGETRAGVRSPLILTGKISIEKE